MATGNTVDTTRVGTSVHTMTMTGVTATTGPSRITANMTGVRRRDNGHGVGRRSGIRGGRGGILGERMEIRGRRIGDLLENSQ